MHAIRRPDAFADCEKHCITTLNGRLNRTQNGAQTEKERIKPIRLALNHIKITHKGYYI